MTSDPTPQAKAGGRRRLFRRRERAANPQLWFFPSDLRVDGARHASRVRLSPSKPCRPPPNGTV